MPFLAKHVQLRQVKTSHAEVLAQDAESEQQIRVTEGVCRLSMKIELVLYHHLYTCIMVPVHLSTIITSRYPVQVFKYPIFYHGRRRRRRRRRPQPHPSRGAACSRQRQPACVRCSPFTGTCVPVRPSICMPCMISF